jgi:pilus assembly protein CpaB
MKPKTMILMGLAITCGLGASYMTQQLLAERQAPEEQKVLVLVAKRPLSIGEPIRKPEEMFEIKEFPAGKEPKDSLPEKELQALKGKMMKTSLRQGDHVTNNDFSGEGGLQIPPGHYAMGFPVNMASSASGFATLPLSRVDILLIIKRGDDKSSKAKVLLRNILVLAADINIDRQTGIAAPASVVTFALRPEEALKMRLAQEMGPLTLALRQMNDKSIPETPDINGEIITTDGKKVDEAPADEMPKYTNKVPSVLPSIASKPAVSAQLKPQVQPSVPADDPNGISQTLTVMNGRDVRHVHYRTTEDGREIIDLETSPAPPRKKGATQKGEF